MGSTRHGMLEMVEFRVAAGRWPAGTIGTVVESDGEQALVEITEDRGHALDFVSMPHDGLATRRQTTRQIAP